jgi:AcrR family transcriptional regulator
MLVNMVNRSRAFRGALNRSRIVEAAIKLIDEEGLASLTARQLAARLGCKAMSLYNHIASMDDLLDAIVDELLASVVRSAADADIASAASKYLALADRHPDAFVLVATRVWRGPHAKAAAMAFVAYFQATGCSEREALKRARVLGAYLNGSGLALGAWKRGEEAARRAGDEKAVQEDLEAGLADVLTMLSVGTLRSSSKLRRPKA